MACGGKHKLKECPELKRSKPWCGNHFTTFDIFRAVLEWIILRMTWCAFSDQNVWWIDRYVGIIGMFLLLFFLSSLVLIVMQTSLWHTVSPAFSDDLRSSLLISALTTLRSSPWTGLPLARECTLMDYISVVQDRPDVCRKWHWQVQVNIAGGAFNMLPTLD